MRWLWSWWPCTFQRGAGHELEGYPGTRTGGWEGNDREGGEGERSDTPRHISKVIGGCQTHLLWRYAQTLCRRVPRVPRVPRSPRLIDVPAAARMEHRPIRLITSRDHAVIANVRVQHSGLSRTEQVTACQDWTAVNGRSALQ